MDRETGRSRGFGFVAFQQEASIERAIHGLDNKDFGGRTITVNRAKERDEMRCVRWLSARAVKLD
jgi:RNA recognition motif-containing protein